MTQAFAGYCTLCRSRCGSLNIVEDGRLVEVQPLPDHPSGGALCAKGRAAPEIAGSPRRLTTPLRRTNPRSSEDPGWEEVSWDEALTDIAQRLQSVKQESGAEAVAFASTTPSGTPIVDSIDWIERLTRRFGSPNLVYAVEICGWHKDYAHALTFGRGIGAPDYDQAETIILWGHNPARTWLAQASRIAEARSRGAKVVVIDPKKAGSGQQSDLWLRVRPGADAALALGAIRHLLCTGTYDADFVRSWTNAPMLVDVGTGGFVRADQLWEGADPESFVVHDQGTGALRPYDPEHDLERPGDVGLEGRFSLTDVDGRRLMARPAFSLLDEHCEPWTAEAVSHATTIDIESLEAFYDLLSTERRVAYHSWTGVGQHSNATQTERSIATLYALLGACDRPGGNLWLQPPAVNPLAPYTDLPQAQRDKALGLKELPLGPPRLGWTTARHFCRAAIEGDPYRVRALVSFGNNMSVSQADADRTRQALEALDLYVHVDMFMNPTAEMADYVLPANTPWERDALRVGFEITQEAVEYVQFRPQMIQSVGQSRADYDIAVALAMKLGLGEEFFDGDVRAGWDWHLEPTGVSLDELIEGKRGIRVPQPTSREKYAERREDGTVAGFATPTRRVELYSQQLLDHGYRPLPSYVEPIASTRHGRSGQQLPLVLSTHKNGVYVHSSHRHVASLRRRAPDPHFDISPELAAERGLVEGEWAVLETENGTTRARIRLDEDLHPTVVLADFGWWEDCPPLGLPRTPVSGEGTLNINSILSDEEHDPTSGSVPLRAVACELRQENALSQGHWAGRQQVEVVRTWNASDSVAGLTLAPVTGRLHASFRPGQHVLLSQGEDGPSRAYSVTRGGNHHTFDIAVRRIPDGVVSGFIHDEVREGSALWLEAPQGTFTPPLETDRPVVLMAGGVGITPFLGYLRSLRTASERPPSVTLLQVFRNSREHPFRAELAKLEAELPELSTKVWYSQPLPGDRPGLDYDLPGRLSAKEEELPLDQRPLVYLCGSSELMDQATEDLVARGVPRFDVFREDFHSTVEVPPDLKPAAIRLRDGEEFTWEPSDGSILSAADRGGQRLPSGCRVGQCESCAVRVLSGSVAHVGESPADDVCLTCIAVPIGEVTLDV